MDNYEKIGDIGKGSFGVVSKIKRKSDGKILVWKELNYGKMKDKEKQQLVSEVNILRELHHPNIVRYYDRIIDKEQTKIFIVMEFCEQGDMAGLIKKLRREKEFMQEEKIWKVLAQVTSALYGCHRKKEGSRILHRDLKPGNVFFDNNWNVKLGDFGLSRMMGEESVYAQTHVGTPYYMSPEQISDEKYNEKSDIWSAGCVIYELTSLRAPFEATNQIQLAMKIKNGKIERIPSQFSEELFKVIQWMMHLDKNKRPSVEDLMQHPRISKYIKESGIKEIMNGIKKKEDELIKKEKVIKEKETDIEKQLREIEEKEKALKEWEERLRARQVKMGTMAGNQNEKVITQDSPKIMKENNERESNAAGTTRTTSVRRNAGNSQSRDAIPSMKDQRTQLENARNKEVYASNDNFQKAKLMANKNYTYLGKNEELKRGEYNTMGGYETPSAANNGGPPLSFRKQISSRDNINPQEKTFAKPPIMKQGTMPEKVLSAKPSLDTLPKDENLDIEAQRRKLAMLRAGYTQHGDISRHSRQSSRDKQNITGTTGGVYVSPSHRANTSGTYTSDYSSTFLKRNDRSTERGATNTSGQQEYMPVRRPSTHNGSNSTKNIRHALEEITQKIQNKYLS